MDEKFMMVLTTVGSEKHAEKISKELVNKELAACVQVLGPMKSTYKWKEELQVDKEWMCFIKSRKDIFEELQNKIKSLHPYENPEIISFDISHGSKEYLSWVDENTKCFN